MTCVAITAMTTASGTPSDQRMIGMKAYIATDPCDQSNQQPSFSCFVPRFSYSIASACQLRIGTNSIMELF
jgi:hypothetical protein